MEESKVSVKISQGLEVCKPGLTGLATFIAHRKQLAKVWMGEMQ
jgi:hypothetical protein